MENKFDIKSSTIEKGLEIAKSFVDKLVMPTVEETGLLMKDHMTMWRFKNQIKMLNKAQEYCVKHQISPKKISLKVLAPLLEYSSLEEEEEMQDKWSILLTNLIDSEQNIENHVFPYILSQLSKDEFFPLEQVFANCTSRRYNLSFELEKFKKEKISNEKEIQERIQVIQKEIEEFKKNEDKSWNTEIWKLESKKRELEREIRNLEYQEHKIKYSISRAELIPEDLFREFENSNLIRLGLVKEIREFYAESQTLEIPISKDDGYGYSSDYANVDLQIDMESTTEFVLTQLGELFFKACAEKH
ncbi:Abi-alpha family protein [Kaistella carnis]|uniref:Abi-alpha family protein n=1 Tax=Kaistella carnis TaxID=1241979 RepID=UPI0028A0D6FC|nr:Abi-alpha family protein [Kaistella carnis]